MRRAAGAPCRRRPLSSTLGVVNHMSASPSSANAVRLRLGAVGALGQQAAVAVASKGATSASTGSGACVNIQVHCLSSGRAGALGQQEGFRCAHVLRRSRDLVEVSQSANSMRVAPLLLNSPAVRRGSLSSTHPVRLALWPAAAVVGAHGWQCWRRSLAWPASARSTPGTPPNRSFNRTANGMSPWPRGGVVHHAPRGQGATPSSAG
jgi:hypothetical protein